MNHVYSIMSINVKISVSSTYQFLIYFLHIDLDTYLEPTRSRCGNIFSPEKLLSKNKINFLKPWKDPYEDKKGANDAKKTFVAKKDIKIDTLIKNSGINSNAGVMRLLRHLKKARLEELQQSQRTGPDTEA